MLVSSAFQASEESEWNNKWLLLPGARVPAGLFHKRLCYVSRQVLLSNQNEGYMNCDKGQQLEQMTSMRSRV